MLDVSDFKQIICSPLDLIVVHVNLTMFLRGSKNRAYLYSKLSGKVNLIEFHMNIVEHEFFGNNIDLFVINGLIVHRWLLLFTGDGLSCSN